MNLPNKLSLLRIILVPVFMLALIFPVFGDTVSRIVALVIFIVAAYTDFLDGKIARKYGLVTDLGKFLDPVADKLMIIGALIGFLPMCSPHIGLSRAVAIVTFVVVFRELAITSLRMVISDGKGEVMAANWLGKCKTVTQIFCICTLFAEPVIFGAKGLCGIFLLSYIALLAMGIITLWSGINYLLIYLPVINGDK